MLTQGQTNYLWHLGSILPCKEIYPIATIMSFNMKQNDNLHLDHIHSENTACTDDDIEHKQKHKCLAGALIFGLI